MERTSPPAGAGEPGIKPPAPAKAKTAASKPAAKAAGADAGGEAAGASPRKLHRRFVWTSIGGFLGINLLMFLRFFFPRTLFEPSSKFRIGFPSDFPIGVDERYKQSNRIWVVRQPDKLFVILAKCTHLGCTPNWVETENKFKCPCHGSGYDVEGVNFEGPAPRPMDRTYVELDAEGQIVVDTSRLYSCAPGAPCQFETDSNSYLTIA